MISHSGSQTDPSTADGSYLHYVAPTIRSDPAKTQERIANLGTYMAQSVFGVDGFVCTSAGDCRKAALVRNGHSRDDRVFFEGQLSHVGLHYDTFQDHEPWRVVLIGKEIGRSDVHISLEERRLQQDAAIGTPFTKRHPHMLGTTSALRAAFGHPLGNDRAGELLQLANMPDPQHVMQCYALLNKRLCSAVKLPPPGGRKYQAASVPTMDRKCAPHLVASIQILEPTLVVLQSTELRRLIASHLRNVENIRPGLEYAEFGGVETMIASFSHPAAHSPLNWGSSHDNAYAKSIVAPTIAAAREFWLR